MTNVESDVLAANLPAYLEEVIGEGRTFVITMNGRPVAELCPPVGAMVALYYETKSMPDERELERCRELMEQVGLVRIEVGRKYGVEADSTVLIREDRDFLH